MAFVVLQRGGSGTAARCVAAAVAAVVASCDPATERPPPSRDAGVVVSRLRTAGPASDPDSRQAADLPPLAELAAVQRGAASPTCVQGWLTPARGTALRKAPLDLMRRRPGDLFMIAEMRYFRGPEDADVVDPQPMVERWYVRAHVLRRPQVRGRWLIRRSALDTGIDARARYDSRGYEPGTWTRPDVPTKRADPFHRPCRDARGNEPCSGLPREVLGCLDGT